MENVNRCAFDCVACMQALLHSVNYEALTSRYNSNEDIVCLVLVTVHQNCKTFTLTELYALLVISDVDSSK